LRVLDGQRGLGRLRGFSHRGLGGREVELDQLLDAFERLAGEAEKGVDVGLLGVDDLFDGDHLGSPGGGGALCGCFMLHRNMNEV
jgi:hypothetical protein